MFLLLYTPHWRTKSFWLVLHIFYFQFSVYEYILFSTRVILTFSVSVAYARSPIAIWILQNMSFDGCGMKCIWPNHRLLVIYRPVTSLRAVGLAMCELPWCVAYSLYTLITSAYQTRHKNTANTGKWDRRNGQKGRRFRVPNFNKGG